MTADLKATADFRTVTRSTIIGGVQGAVQQRFLCTTEAGTTKERSFYVWLDVDHEMFATTESEPDIKLRKEVEQMRTRIVLARVMG